MMRPNSAFLLSVNLCKDSIVVLCGVLESEVLRWIREHTQYWTVGLDLGVGNMTLGKQ